MSAAKEKPCVWCGDKTDYHTFDERPICIGCAREKGEDLFNRFGRQLAITVIRRTSHPDLAAQPPFNTKKEPA